MEIERTEPIGGSEIARPCAWLASLPLTLFVFLLSASLLHAAPKPNIVHILTDDFGWQDPVCFDVDGDTPLDAKSG